MSPASFLIWAAGWVTLACIIIHRFMAVTS